MSTNERRIEFGDFQTPDALAQQVTVLLRSLGVEPASVVEPTCGLGAFLSAACHTFIGLESILGFDINPDYLHEAHQRISRNISGGVHHSLRPADFFTTDWRRVLESQPEPVLILGNPPWVTSAGLGILGSTNLPEKSNFQNHAGIDAITGKGNFDIAEWMVLKLLDAAGQRRAVLAMLMKTSVARRILKHIWASGLPVVETRIFEIDAKHHFGVAASACLFFCRLGSAPPISVCPVSNIDQPAKLRSTIGWRDGILVADAVTYDQWLSLLVDSDSRTGYRWRSGVKHDCSSVMELQRHDSGGWVNGLGEVVDIEREFVFPLAKGTDLVRNRVVNPAHAVVVTQRATGEDTSRIAHLAPRTWAYLCRHGELLDRRRSSIYRKRHRFSIFGVGPYTFSPWKVAVSGLHKKLRFVVIGQLDDCPIVVDDTCYHLSCESEEEARLLENILNSEVAQRLLAALTFSDAKRPATVEVLRRLDIFRLAAYLDRESELSRLLLVNANTEGGRPSRQTGFAFDGVAS